MTDGAPGERRRVDLPEGRVLVVGRDDACDLRLDGAAVSRRHLRIEARADGVYIVDLGSHNGTTIRRGSDGRTVLLAEETRVEVDDRVRVAQYTILPVPTPPSGVYVVAQETASRFEIPTPFPSMPSGPGEEATAHRSIVQGLEAAFGDTAARPAGSRAALVMLAAAAGAHDGCLFSRIHDALVLRAHLAEGRSVPLSETFIARVLASEGFVVSGTGDSGESASLESRTSPTQRAIRLGLRLAGAKSQPLGIVCLDFEHEPPAPSLAALRVLLPVATSIVAADLELDREIRRREAAEGRAGDHADVSDSGDGHRPESALVGTTKRFRAAVDAARRAARSKSTVLVRGASGTGKDVLARFIHESSPRAEQPFVALNCASIPSELVESELFGHDRGAFTGAETESRGAFQRAHGGTLFLDEIGDLSLAAQAKVLRALEAGEIVRVGGSVHPVDVRVIVATHRALEEMVGDGRFREDLYYRLRVIEISLPSLAERKGDIIPLAEHFLRLLQRANTVSIAGISVEAARCLQSFPWRGNVRELRNVIERAVVLDSDGVIDLDDLPADICGGRPSGEGEPARDRGALYALPWRDARRRFAREYFAALLEKHAGRVAESSASAGITRRALTTFIKELGLRSVIEKAKAAQGDEPDDKTTGG